MTTKKTRIKHAPEFKAEAPKLAEKVGVAADERQLSLYEYQIYGWRKAVQYETIMTREEMCQALFEYIEVDYNRTRRHSALKYLSPVNVEKQYVA